MQGKEFITSSRGPIELSGDPKRKARVLASSCDDIPSLFLIPFFDHWRALAVPLEKYSAVFRKAAVRFQGENSANAPITEQLKPWMALSKRGPSTGYGGNFGLQKIWDEGLRGQGVTVGMFDTGLVQGHAEFDYTKIRGEGLFSSMDENLNVHGTSVAGIIGARANGLGVVGVANECNLWIEKLPAETTSYKKYSFVKDAVDAGCDLLNNSWLVDFPGESDLQKYLNKEFDRAARGRNGLGMSLVFGAGNDRQLGFDTAVQPSTNHENVITVAAVNPYTAVTDYSTPGECVHVAAPGDDLISVNGNDPTGTSFKITSGTSYAAPFVSGVVALIYQSNPGLGLRDVQEILAHSASLPLGEISEAFSFNGGRHANGGGMHFSRDYGFGLVNAHKAVRLAQSWFGGGFQEKISLNRQQQVVNFYKKTGTAHHFTMTFSPAKAGEVEHVKLRLGIDVKDINDLRVVLTSPQGTKSVLMDSFGEKPRSFNNLIDLGSRRFWGENATGEWSVSISSRRSLNKLWGSSLILSGGTDTQDDRYIYTDEFNGIAMADPRRLVLADNDGGRNAFNAACVTDDAVIDLRAGKFRFGNGPQGQIAAGTVIETVIGGDGNDLITGGDYIANRLRGGQGDDTLSGGVGRDTLVGGAGNDTYTVDDELDVVIEKIGEGIDLINSSIGMTLPENVDALVLTTASAEQGMGNALDNLIRGSAGDNHLSGAGGNDILEGADGNDLLCDGSGRALFNGGGGNDSLGGGAGAEIYLGGQGNDTLTTGGGNDVILFNKGDGKDTVSSRGAGSTTLSIGGDFTYGDMRFSKVSDDLVLTLGTSDQMTFVDWYGATPARSVVNLQLIAEAMSGFVAGGSDTQCDPRVEHFDFARLVGAFDAERAATPGLYDWALMKVLSDFRQDGTDSEAFGGDLAYQYGRHGTLAGIGFDAAQAVIGDSAFGAQAQALYSRDSLQSGALRLS